MSVSPWVSLSSVERTFSIFSKMGFVRSRNSSTRAFCLCVDILSGVIPFFWSAFPPIVLRFVAPAFLNFLAGRRGKCNNYGCLERGFFMFSRDFFMKKPSVFYPAVVFYIFAVWEMKLVCFDICGFGLRVVWVEGLHGV